MKKMNQIMENKKYSNKAFEEIKHIDENGNEYWLARELQKVLEYSKWDKFLNVINRAKIAFNKSKKNGEYDFPQVGKIV
jgi:DNA-damage-inducible protein D